MGKYAGKYVKNEFYSKEEIPEKSIDVEIAIQLKEENKAFSVAKYEHSYPHCWRTDKPILYYPLDSWFIKVTQEKEKFIALNKKINWKPKSTGTGRFGNWLENANDWNLSRSRFWGTPIPIWRSEDGTEEICISSIEQLKNECEKAVTSGFMEKNPLSEFIIGDMTEKNYSVVDLHKNYVDEITLVSESGKPMKRESDLIDVWFDSGSMPYAQWHYPFENKELIDGLKTYPADFIAEGVDQTRGWFYTLHAISAMCFNSEAYKNVVSNGLVLDKSGQKMSKRVGNVVDPFETLEKYGPDATRWYMLTNAQPWDNLRFNLDGITEVQRKFFGTLYNTYGFFALYANLDEFQYNEKEIPLNDRPEIDRWILSKLNSLIKNVDHSFENYEPTKAGRFIQLFVIDQLSNWYVRLCRRRFWKGEFTNDKLSAYQTLYTCLEAIARLSSPIAPFFSDRLFRDLISVTKKHKVKSVHLSSFPKYNTEIINLDLEERMEIAQRVCSLVLGLRKKEKIKVRQPLQKIMVPAINENFKKQLISVKSLILSELNVKELEVLTSDSNVIKKKVKPNFKTIGPKYGKHMKAISSMINAWGDDEINTLENKKSWSGVVNGDEIELLFSDFEIQTADVPGFLVSSDNDITVALDIQITDELINEGIARDFVNRIQNLRKDYGFNVTDRINIRIMSNNKINRAINNNLNYICSETLAESLEIVNTISDKPVDMELGNGLLAECSISKIN
jgi:isoleucyl-tRNA synthetase